MAKSKREIESYAHTGEERANNPPVGLVTDRDAGAAAYAYDPHLEPRLDWAGKAEHASFTVPTVSLHSSASTRAPWSRRCAGATARRGNARCSTRPRRTRRSGRRSSSTATGITGATA